MVYNRVTRKGNELAENTGGGNKKTMHINLTGAQVEDYRIVKAYTGIMNDNDLVRHLFREKANTIRGTFPLLSHQTPAPQAQER